MPTIHSISPSSSVPVKLGGLLGAQWVRRWMGTIDHRVAFYDQSADPAIKGNTARIYVFWHENILMPLYLRGRCRISMLLSQHRDADILSRVAYHLGFDCVRGSTNRGGVRAIREMLRKGQQTHLAITPDGPRGPRRQLAVGPVYLASRLGMPLVVMGYGYDRPWRAQSWDRFAVPRPFSRARGVLSPPLDIPPDLDRQGLENARQRTERLLNDLTVEAEAWAESDSAKVGEVVVRPVTTSRQLTPGRSHRKAA